MRVLCNRHFESDSHRHIYFTKANSLIDIYLSALIPTRGVIFAETIGRSSNAQHPLAIYYQSDDIVSRRGREV